MSTTLQKHCLLKMCIMQRFLWIHSYLYASFVMCFKYGIRCTYSQHNCYVTLTNTHKNITPWCWHHDFTFPHMLWHGLHACVLLNISAPCVPNEHWAALRTDKSPLCDPWPIPGAAVHGFHISPYLSSWYLSIYVYCMCQSAVLHPLLELIPQLARRRSRRMKLNVCILHAFLHSDYISTVSMITKITTLQKKNPIDI